MRNSKKMMVWSRRQGQTPPFERGYIYLVLLPANRLIAHLPKQNNVTNEVSVDGRLED